MEQSRDELRIWKILLSHFINVPSEYVIFFFFQIYVIWLNAVKIEGLTLMKVGCFMWNKQCTVPSPFPLGKKKNHPFYLPFILSFKSKQNML